MWRIGLLPHGEPAGEGSRQLALPLEPTSPSPPLRAQTDWEEMLADYRHTSISLGPHPLALLRSHLPAGCVASSELAAIEHDCEVTVAGLAVARQRPATAKGVVFMLLEDEHGHLNLIVPPGIYARHRAVIRSEPLLLAHGRFERVGRNENIVVFAVESLGPLARREPGEAEVYSALPAPHHFGHR